ncbi:Alkaline ceramidase [Hondaea fermentalgiana]|uniref:Alkaline ceramidase n=1 Tax=Hondaea fermentalgiana TaxID=2315210 RepID=A0A2R5GN32_9STRA|nr:Alkaline ceramidase [Hondaea fermentalgiana]|eukprot:GBG32312.1 Alkaline ceramidase [Hondaea fermentalgiana]
MARTLIGAKGASLPVGVLGASVFVTTAMCFALLALADGSWENWQQATCLQTQCFCERPRDGLLRQPANTWSNLAFSVTGVLALCESIEQKLHSRTLKETPLQKLGLNFVALFGMSNILLGFGSGWYHASLTLYGQFIDNAGMYLVCSAPALYALACMRLHRAGPKASSAVQNAIVHRFLVEFLMVNAGLGWLCLVYPVTRRYIFFSLVAFAAACEIRARHECGPERAQRAEGRVFFAGLATFLLAFAIWIADIRGWICDPDSLFQGHAVWHLLCGLASWLIFLYFHRIIFGVQHLKAGAVNAGDCSIV